MSSYPPIRDLIPHAAPMILIDAMTHWEDGKAEARAQIRELAPFVEDGKVESVVTIEYMAQTVAACLGYQALLGGSGVRVGMIIAVKRFTAHQGPLYVGDKVDIVAKRIRGNDMLSHFDCQVVRAGEPFSEAVLTLYHAEKPPEELAG